MKQNHIFILTKDLSVLLGVVKSQLGSNFSQRRLLLRFFSNVRYNRFVYFVRNEKIFLLNSVTLYLVPAFYTLPITPPT